MKKKKHSTTSSQGATLKAFLSAFLPVFVWMVIIFLFSARERVALTGNYAVSFMIFKTAHLFEYGILYALFLRMFIKLKFDKPYLLAFICTILYAGSDELHQRFVPTREGRIRDVLIDVLGATIAYFVISSNNLIKKRLTA